MRKQLSLWPTLEEPPHTPDIWNTLDQQQRKQVITALANLIKKIAYKEKAKQTREINNDR